MTKATDLSTAIETRLDAIKLAAGYGTDVAGVYGFGKSKPDKAPLPCVLVRIASDEKEAEAGNKWQRSVTYQIQGVFPRTASLQDLQRLHHDIIKTIGADPLPGVRPLASGWQVEESTEFDPENDGSSYRHLIVSLTMRYIETY